MPTTTTTEPLTYTEAGVTNNVVCAWCVEEPRTQPKRLATVIKGVWPACPEHAEAYDRRFPEA